ncbi:MAG: DMT family transporter [Micromonosporaceae bacterium]|nr:DMT family transporter [Micromonosporaceae bacterium]
MDRRDLAAVAACVTAEVVLGVSVPLTRGIVDYPVMTGQAARYALAAAALGLLARVGFGGPPPWPGWPRPRDLLALAAVAATGLVGFNACMVTAVRHADPAVVGTIVGAAPLGLALIGPLMRRQRPSGRILIAAALIVAGTGLVHGFGQADVIGTLAALGTLAGEIAFSAFAAVALPRLGAVRVSAYSCALAVPMLVIGAVVMGETPRMPTAVEAATFGYLAVFLTVVAFVAWFSGLNRLGVARGGLFVGLAPVAALVTASIQDGRWPVPAQALGVLVVAVALTFGVGQRTRSSPTPPSSGDADGRPRRFSPVGRTGSASTGDLLASAYGISAAERKGPR